MNPRALSFLVSATLVGTLAAVSPALAAPGTLQFTGTSLGPVANPAAADNVVPAPAGATGAGLTISRVGGNVGALQGNVFFFAYDADGNPLGSRTSTPVNFGNGDSQNRSLQVTIPPNTAALTVAFSAGLLSPSAVTIAVGNRQPTIQITSPPSNVTVVTGSTVNLSAVLTDPGNLLARVNFLLNNVPVGSTTSRGPFTLTATAPPPGTYELKAVAVDTQGRQNTSTRIVTVVAPNAAEPAPTAKLVTPVDGRQVVPGSVIALTTAAPSVDGSLPDRVDFFADNTLIASFDGATGRPRFVADPDLNGGGSEAPRPRVDPAPVSRTPAGIFSAFYRVPPVNKNVNLSAVSVAKSGRTALAGTATAKVNPSTDDQAPRVVINAPATRRAVIGFPLSLPVSVSDPDAPSSGRVAKAAVGVDVDETRPGGTTPGPVARNGRSDQIAKEEQFINGTKVRETNSAGPDQPAPSSGDVVVNPTEAGTYVVTVVATDGLGIATVSDPVIIEAQPLSLVSLSYAPGSPTELREGGPKVKMLVTREGDLSRDLPVSLQFTGSASFNVDYPDPGGLLIIPAGKSSAKLRLKTNDDATKENAESVNVKIVGSPNYTFGVTKKLKVPLLDND